MAKIDIRPFKVTQHIEELTRLAQAHWLENGEHKLAAEGPRIVVETYAVMEQAGYDVVLGAFDGEVMVGYCVVFLMPHPHYGCLFAQHDVLFVAQEYRDSSVGLRLFREMRKTLQERSPQFVLWHAKPGSAFEKILQHARCVVEEVIYRE